jgi:hypothetical protein
MYNDQTEEQKETDKKKKKQTKRKRNRKKQLTFNKEQSIMFLMNETKETETKSS